MKKQVFLREKLHMASKPKQMVPAEDKPGKDAEIEFIQQNAKNKTIPEPILIDNHYLEQKKLIIINKSIAHGQVISLSEMLKL